MVAVDRDSVRSIEASRDYGFCSGTGVGSSIGKLVGKSGGMHGSAPMLEERYGSLGRPGRGRFLSVCVSVSLVTYRGA